MLCHLLFLMLQQQIKQSSKRNSSKRRYVISDSLCVLWSLVKLTRFCCYQCSAVTAGNCSFLGIKVMDNIQVTKRQKKRFLLSNNCLLNTWLHLKLLQVRPVRLFSSVILKISISCEDHYNQQGTFQFV